MITKGVQHQGMKPPIPNSWVSELKRRPTNHRIRFPERSSFTKLPAARGLRIAMFRGQVIRLLVRREASLLDVAAIFGRRARDYFSDVRIAPREFRLVAEAQSQQIVDHQNLAIAIRSRANADRGNPQLGRNSRREFPGDRLENDSERPSRFHRARISQ